MRSSSAESDDGFKLLHAVPGASLPSLGAPAAVSAAADDEARRPAAQRGGSSAPATDGVPAYVVLHDATLRDLAATRPVTPAELADVQGLGPTKIERYGEDIIAVVAAAS